VELASWLQDLLTMQLDESKTGYQIAQTWEYAIDTWNEYMNVYKVCQPCRAYNLNVNFYSMGDEEDGSHSGSRDNLRERFLEENDGQGDPEQWGYDCYDSAGYTNCNQVRGRAT
jgi:hypothetical protein